jgi:hypothetical protein
VIPTAPLASIGIDIGKEVFHVVGFGTDGKIAFRRKIKRLALVEPSTSSQAEDAAPSNSWQTMTCAGADCEGHRVW